MLELNKQHFGDNIELMKQLPDNSIGSIVTDCPYGLGRQPVAEEMLRVKIKESPRTLVVG